MKILISIISIITIAFSAQVKAQNFGLAADVGYSFKFINKPINQLYLGAVMSFHKGRTSYYEDSNMLTLGGGAIYGSYNGQKKLMPALNVGYSFQDKPYLLKASITPYNVTPSINLNLANIIHFGVGYSVGYKKINDVNLSGIVLNVNINIGMQGHYLRWD